MKASVLIRTKNEAAALPRTLALIQRQTCALEVVVVDSGSTDETLAVLRRNAWVKTLQLPEPEFTYGKSLNLGFSVVSGDIVIVLSAHAFPADERWAENLLRHFADPTVAAVYGKQLPHANAWAPVKRDVSEFYGNEDRVQTDPRDPGDHRFSNANAAIRRHCWELRRFDEELPYCEDWDWARAILGIGWKIAYDPEAEVNHSHNESFWQVYKRSANENLAQALLYKSQKYDRYHWFHTWLRAVRSDVRFMRRTHESMSSLLWLIGYRLFWAYGRFAGSKTHHDRAEIGIPLVKSVNREGQ